MQAVLTWLAIADSLAVFNFVSVSKSTKVFRAFTKLSIVSAIIFVAIGLITRDITYLVVFLPTYSTMFLVMIYFGRKRFGAALKQATFINNRKVARLLSKSSGTTVLLLVPYIGLAVVQSIFSSKVFHERSPPGTFNIYTASV